jgi:multiple antibiotic resistance protein
MKLHSQIILLFLVLNPLGNIPVFLSILKGINPRRQTRIIIREMGIALLLLAVFMFFGRYILQWMQISPQALGISGGIILFLIAIRLIFPKHDDEVDKTAVTSEPFIVPLAIPITAGPAAMTTVMLFAPQSAVNIVESVIVLLVAVFASCGVLLSSRYISNVFGKKGLTALERLSGMMLTAMAVQMFLTGLNNYLTLH